MPRIVRMPTLQELPKGARRDFVEAVFSLYKEASRPTLRDVSKEIERGDSAATASPETIRRMLRGTTVPSWRIVNAVTLALCRMAGADQDAGSYDEPTRRELIEFRWNDAIDNPEPARALSSGYSARAEIDPWAVDSNVGGYPDEPPF